MAVSDPGYRPAQVEASPGSQSGVAVAGAEPSLLQWQGPAQVDAGDSLFMQIVVQARQPVVSLPLTVEFDHKVLQVITVAEGEWLKTGNAQTSFSSRVEPQGQVTLNGQRNGEDGAIGSGVFATIQFRALGPVEASSIRLSRAAPVGANGQSIPMPLPAAHLLRILP